MTASFAPTLLADVHSGLQLLMGLKVLNGILRGGWGAAGVVVPKMLDNPESASSLAEFWGSRWNSMIQRMLYREIYRRVTLNPIKKETVRSYEKCKLGFGLYWLC